MKKLIKAAAVTTLILGFAPSINAQDLTSIKAAAEVGQELPALEKLEILREVALEKGIPAEILKAIALKENKELQQFKDDGTPLITADGGIGLMQLTFSDEEYIQYNVNKERLMYDTRYNIEQGAIHLLRKWDNSNLPKVNDHDKNRIEDWYFAIMAYNGLSKRNDPNYSGSKAYQEVVFQYIRDYSLLQIGPTPKLSISYTKPGAPDIMVFPAGVSYKWPSSTKTAQNYKAGDIAYTYTSINSAKIRKSVDGAVLATLPNYTPFHIVSGPYQSSNTNNHFVYYEIKGKNFEGFMAGSNLITSNTVNVFTDVTNELQPVVTYLQARDIIDGYSDTRFEPNNKLTRGQATKLIVEALNLKVPSSDYKLTATDVSPNHPFYEYMRVAEANGIMKGIGGEFQPSKSLTRSDMASILVRAFEDYLANPTPGYKYSGVSTTDPNYTNINKLAYNKITIAKDFDRNGTLTRGDFARFLQRAVEKKEAIK